MAVLCGQNLLTLHLEKGFRADGNISAIIWEEKMQKEERKGRKEIIEQLFLLYNFMYLCIFASSLILYLA